jgi:hypothetical protein
MPIGPAGSENQAGYENKSINPTSSVAQMDTEIMETKYITLLNIGGPF